MSKIKVRLVEGSEPKGVAEMEAELLANHEAEQLSNQAAEQLVVENNNDDVLADSNTNNDEPAIKEEDVLSYIGKRFNKQINSLDELNQQREEAEPMPEDVAAYLKYKKETGRGFEDFLALNKDYDSVNSDDLLKDYLLVTNQGLDSEDVDALMEDYSYDEDLDDESRIKKVKIAKKKAVAEAKKFFNEQKEKYRIPLESSRSVVPDEDKEEYEAYKQYAKSAKTLEEENTRKRQWFEKKTDELFNQEFKGFEFKIEDSSFKFSPGDANELKKSHATPMNLINKFLDENGLIKDTVGYHRALAVAMNPDKFAKFFYDQGVAKATEDVMRKTKNINMSERRAPEVTSKGGLQIRAVNPDSGNGLKIKTIKKL